MAKTARKMLFVVNTPGFFLSHRLPLANAAKASGYEVHVATAFGPGIDQILAQGLVHHVIPFARSGHNPLSEVGAILQLVRLFLCVKPSLIHLITIKPVLYGGIAARLTSVNSVVAAVSGLGTVFLANSFAGKLRRWFVVRLYHIAFNQKKLAVIFQNHDDRSVLISHGVVHPADTRIVRGSGVALAGYPYVPEPKGQLVVVMAARLLRDKGVFEFVEAARVLRSRGVGVKMRLIGSPDRGNPTSVTNRDLKYWAEDGSVELLGHRTDIAAQYAQAHIVCLPSYREGLPKCLIEAAACGRAIVTTDVAGCRDAVIPNVTGILVPVKDAVALADAIQKLVEEPELRVKMGCAGRQLAEEKFAIKIIVDQHLKIYQEVLVS